MALPLTIGKEFTIISDFHPVTFGIFHFFDIHLKVNGAHNAIAEHLMDESFHGGPINLSDFVKPVNKRVDRDGFRQRSFCWILLQRSEERRVGKEWRSRR